MAIHSEFEYPEVAIESDETIIYRVYPDNDYDCSPREFWFTTDESGMDEGREFNIRSLSTYDASLSTEEILRTAITVGELTTNH